MSRTKRFLEEISIDMGLDGEITSEVLEEANERTNNTLFASRAQARRLLYLVNENTNSVRSTSRENKDSSS